MRELDKLEVHTRQGVVLQPRYNGRSPPRLRPAQPWEPFLPPITGNEGNWREWEVGGRPEALRNPWVCTQCGVKNRPLYAHPDPLHPAPEHCDACSQQREFERDYADLLGLPRPERPRAGEAPDPGDMAPCYCNVCRGQLDQDRENWREHYFDGARWELPPKPKSSHAQRQTTQRASSPSSSSPGGGSALAVSGNSNQEEEDPSWIGHRAPTVARFHREPLPVYEKHEFHNAHLKDFLIHAKDVVNLELSLQGLGDDGSVAAAQALHGNKRVAIVNLSANGISFAGCKAWGAFLGLSSSSLLTLDLSRNGIGASGAACLARGLAHNTALRTLLIDGNNVGNFGAQSMVQPLSSNVTLVALGLTSNGIATAVGDQVRAAVAKNRNPRDVARLEVLY